MSNLSGVLRHIRHHLKYYIKQGLLVLLILFAALIASMIIRGYMQAQRLPAEGTQNVNSASLINDDVVVISDTIKSVKHPDFARIFSTPASYADAKEDLLGSIAANGMVVSNTSYAKDMLANTAEVSGVKTPVYNEAEIVSFCKADLSHALVKANPHNIVLCPYAIAIYVLHDEPERVYLSFRIPEISEAATQPIQELLIKIIDDIVW